MSLPRNIFTCTNQLLTAITPSKTTTLKFVKSPIALFVFKRPQETLQTLECLTRNRGVKDHPLYIFCDASRRADEEREVAETRKIVRSRKWTDAVSIIEKEKNQGLANSIISGVDQLCEKHGRAIIIEDDLLLADSCLEYFEHSLERFASVESIMQISGHRFFDAQETESNSSFLMPVTTTWGWATWSRAWKFFDPAMKGVERLRSDSLFRHRFDLDNSYPYSQMVEAQIQGGVDSWGIRWVWAMFNNNGLTLYPTKSLVKNIGFSPSSHHTKTELPWMRSPDWHPSNQVNLFPQIIQPDLERFSRIKRMFKRNTSQNLYHRIRRRIHSASVRTIVGNTGHK